jgi:hypothetical protein
LTKPLIFDYRLLFSEKAKEKIENSGSKIQWKFLTFLKNYFFIKI